MAIEIKELVIKLTVRKSDSEVKIKSTSDISSQIKKEIVKDCVEKVLQRLESKIER